ncbi:hypothetical protein MRS44_001152 [Fusarium solani]|uniref:uncharacterized protein n=1 Tax=Fusarium solani TaxID=169388 RepID=UPI0032C4176A|nr:hypothetical protein MRS44_001152 [Fusarium solani]
MRLTWRRKIAHVVLGCLVAPPIAHQTTGSSPSEGSSWGAPGEKTGGETEGGTKLHQTSQSGTRQRAWAPRQFLDLAAWTSKSMLFDGAMDALVDDARGAPARCKPHTHTFSSPVSWADEHLSIAQRTLEIVHAVQTDSTHELPEV